MSNIFLELFQPFGSDEIEWRVGATKADKTSGLALAYVDSRAVMRRLDLVLGPMNWADRYQPTDKSVVCSLSVKIGNEWITKEDGADQTDIESTKGGIATAFKRAAVKFGIGRYLYDLPPMWVVTEPYGSGNKQTAILKDEGKKQAAKKLDEFMKNYYKLTPVLTKPQWDKLIQNLGSLPLTPKEVFGTDEINVLAATNLSLLASKWGELTDIQKEVEVFKVSYATFSGLPYVYSRFV